MNDLLDKINDINIDLSEYEIEELNDIEKQNIKRRVKKKIYEGKKKSRRKIALVAVAIGTFILVSIPNPVMAALKDFVFDFRFGNDNGIESAESNNYIQAIEDEKFSNDKVDIKLNNVMVDSSMIALDYEVYFKDGRTELNKDLYYSIFGDTISLYDENGNVIYKDGTIGAINGVYDTFEVDSEDTKKGHYKVFFTSSEAKIPKIEKLNVKFNDIKLENSRNEEVLSEHLNWDCSFTLSEMFRNYKALEYKWKDTENIKVQKATSLPTGVVLKFTYTAKGHDSVNDILNMNLVTEDGIKVNTTGANVEDSPGGEQYKIIFNGISSFDDVDKFTLEIKNPDGSSIDKVEFTK